MEQKNEFVSNRDAIDVLNDRLELQYVELERVQSKLHSVVVRTVSLKSRQKKDEPSSDDDDPDYLRRYQKQSEDRLSRRREFDRKAEQDEKELQEHLAKQREKLNGLRLQKTQLLCDIATHSSDCDHYREKLKRIELQKLNLAQQVHHSQMEYDASVAQLGEKQAILDSMRNAADQLRRNLEENIRQFQALSVEPRTVSAVTSKPTDEVMTSPPASTAASAELTEEVLVDIDLDPAERAELDAEMEESLSSSTMTRKSPSRSEAPSAESDRPLAKRPRLSPRESSSSPSPSPPPPSPGRGLPTSKLPRIPKVAPPVLADVPDDLVVDQVLASKLFHRNVENNEGRIGKEDPRSFRNLLLLTDDIGSRTCLGRPLDSFFGRRDPLCSKLVGLPNPVVDCSATFDVLPVRTWHVSINGFAIFFGADPLVTLSDPDFLPMVKKSLNFPEDLDFDGLFILGGTNDFINVADPAFVVKWERSHPEMRLSFTHEELGKFLLQKLQDFARKIDLFCGFVGAGSCPGVSSVTFAPSGTVGYGPDAVRSLVFHFGKLVEDSRCNQVLLPAELRAQEMVAWLPLPVYADEAFVPSRTPSEFKRFLTIKAYAMFARDMVNRAAVYCSGLSLGDKPSPLRIYACGGLLPMLSPAGKHYRGRSPVDRKHHHDGQLCTVISKAVEVVGLRSNFYAVEDQEVSRTSCLLVF